MIDLGNSKIDDIFSIDHVKNIEGLPQKTLSVGSIKLNYLVLIDSHIEICSYIFTNLLASLNKILHLLVQICYQRKPSKPFPPAPRILM